LLDLLILAASCLPIDPFPVLDAGSIALKSPASPLPLLSLSSTTPVWTTRLQRKHARRKTPAIWEVGRKENRDDPAIWEGRKL
jgi:hypothetical protein